MSGPVLSDLVRGHGLRGAPSVLSVQTCTRVGRALGTLLRQRAGGAGRTVVVARSQDGAQLAIRDGLVRGLLLSGQHVKDVGACGADQFAFALESLLADAGVHASSTEGAVHTLSFWLGGKPLTAEDLAALCAIGDAAAFAAGEGTLEVLAVRPASRAQPAEGAQ